ncbi:MAG: DUF2339 domain-containing protein [Candidatus Rokubacteria bacterium]|nr:DUF2339 domain-containing protein [Candidatus Rokubacteria bacterium]
MSFLIFILAVAALFVALKALRDGQPRPGQPTPAERIAGLEERVRDLLYRVWTLEQQRDGVQPQPEAPPAPAPTAPVPSAHEPLPSPAWSAAAAAVQGAAVHATAPPPAPAPRLDLEQRIGARWTTWVGVVAILLAASFFVKWSIENNLIGPRARLGLGMSAGITLLTAGLALHRRRDVPYLSEGLSGLGLGLCYLSLYAGYAYYGLLPAGAAFGLMFIVTVLGSGVAVVSERQVTAVLALLGGLLTPVLLAQPEPNERVLLGYLVVLDLLVLAIARFRTWTALNRLAWAGTVLLLAPTFLRYADAPYPVARLVLLSALFLLFLLTPLARAWGHRGRIDEVDLLFVAGTAAGYFWAVYVTLEAWWPLLEAPAAMALAILYTALAGFYRRRVSDDDETVGVLMGVACVFLTLAMPLALKGPWITLAWAAEGAVLLSVAPRLVTPVAAWGGTLALFLAAFRVVGVDKWGSAYWTPVWNPTYLAHLLTVAAIVLAGQLALALRPGQLLRLSREGLRSTLWVMASLTLSVLLWREPQGLWPAGLLIAQLLVLGFLVRVAPSPAFVVAVPLAAFTVLVRTLGADDTMARASAEQLVNIYTLMRVLACVVLAVAGAGLAASGASRYADPVGRALSGTAAVVLLFVLSQAWTRYLDVAIKDMRAPGQSARASELRWRMQLGLSLLWTAYAAATLAWGFLRRSVALRYAALCLFGLTIVKVFFVDMASVKTAYRMLSLLVLGVVLLLVGLMYQKASRRPAAPESPRIEA